MSMNEHVAGLVIATRPMVRNAQLQKTDKAQLEAALTEAEMLAKQGSCGRAIANVQFVLATLCVLSPSLYEGPPT